MNPPVNNSFREVLQDLLQLHVVFCYLQAIEQNSAEGEKQDVGLATTCPAETWVLCPVTGSWVQQHVQHKCRGFCWHGLKLKKNIVVQRSK